jgi:DHA1 family multidrug resistance protein-like MFS transporter
VQVPTLSRPAIDDEDPSVPVVVAAIVAGVFFGGVADRRSAARGT